MEEEKLYTLGEVAKMTRLTDRTLRNYLANGTLKGRKCGGQWRFSDDDIRALFKSSEYYEKRTDQLKENIDSFMNHKMSFISPRASLLVIDIKDLDKDQVKALISVLREIPKDSDVKESVSIFEDNLRIVFIAGLDYISKVLDAVKEA